jgi:hypothetical protein
MSNNNDSRLSLGRPTDDGKSPRLQSTVQECYKEALKQEKLAVKAMVQQIFEKAIHFGKEEDEEIISGGFGHTKGGKSKFLNS